MPEESEKKTLASRRGSPIRILHVDDDRAITELFQAYLERHGRDWAEVECANSAQEGLDLLETGRFDCIVSDYSMPETDGLEFLTAVRRTFPVIPFILFTGQGSEEVASEAIAAGVTDYIQKGGAERLELLENRIEHAVAEHDLRREVETEAQKFKAVFERASDAILLADDQGRYVDANPEACGLFGLRREELVGKTAADFTDHEFDFTTAWEQFRASSRERGRFSLRRPDGARRTVEYVATADIIPGLHLSILRPLPEEHTA